MKRISRILLVHLALVGLVACGGGNDPGNGPEVVDSVPPVTLSPLAVESVSHQGVTLSVGINEAGVGYYLVQPAATQSPSIAAVLEGALFDTAAQETDVFDVQSLSPSTDYKLYFVAADRAGNVQAELQIVAFQTAVAPDLTPPQVLSWGMYGRTEGGGTFRIQVDEAGKVFYLVRLTDEAVPTRDELLEAASADILPDVWSYAEIAGLAASTAYTIYFLVQDEAGNVNHRISYTYGLQTLAPLYVESGGLLWMPNYIGPWANHEANWSTADNYCRNTTINGTTGWRLPTVAELQGLVASGVTLRVPEWQGGGPTWASDPDGTDSHWVMFFSHDLLETSLSHNPGWVSCVRALDTASVGG